MSHSFQTGNLIYSQVSLDGKNWISVPQGSDPFVYPHLRTDQGVTLKQDFTPAPLVEEETTSIPKLGRKIRLP